MATAKKAVKKSATKKAAKKAPAKKAVKKAKSPFGKKFIGEMKARLEEELGEVIRGVFEAVLDIGCRALGVANFLLKLLEQGCKRLLDTRGLNHHSPVEVSLKLLSFFMDEAVNPGLKSEEFEFHGQLIAYPSTQYPSGFQAGFDARHGFEALVVNL